MQGTLFSNYFLDEGIVELDGWSAFDDAGLASARLVIGTVIADFEARDRPNEAETEAGAVDTVLDLLGWHARSRQIGLNPTGRADVPDYLLHEDAAAKARADAKPGNASRHGVAILEAKRWGRPLDSAKDDGSSPAAQLRRYLSTVEGSSGGKVAFGILTNGHCWRLYRRSASLDDYIEINLPNLIDDDHRLRQFVMLFGRDAFVAQPGGRTRLDIAIQRSRDFEARVTEALAKTVFERVYPDLATALYAADPQAGQGERYRGELREAALTWLYRLLFVLYAEDRDLLPTRERPDGLHATRTAVADALDQRTALSDRRHNYDGDLRALWKQIDEGDSGIGLPPYNGRLFKGGRSALLDRALISDAAFAPLLDAMSREHTGVSPRFINFRDLSVQHLGSVYERLLEYDLIEEDGRIVTRAQAFARKTSGSYYTPEPLVMLVLRRTIGPLLDEKRAAFAEALKDREHRDQDPAYRLPWLQQFDPASAFLTLRIVDPAMGSGHFLVSLVDYLAGEVFEAIAASAKAVEGYRSPLLDRLEAMRARILERSAAHGWTVAPAQLDDQRLIRRIILKRVVHGVDKNPMAVELAKLSLWLHSFTVGAPLSFLDHHLRCGDSLFGEWLGPAVTRLEAGGLFKRDLVTKAQQAIVGMARVEDLADSDIAEVRESYAAFEEAREGIEPLERYLSLLQGYRWIEGSAEDARKRAKLLQKAADRATGEESLTLSREAWNLRRRGSALDVLLEGGVKVDGAPADADRVLDIAYGRVGDRDAVQPGDDPAIEPLVKAARIARVSNFLHWELAFPTVWTDWLSPSRRGGGFDAVVGNPPWDRLKMQEVEWFAARRRDIAYATRAADRTRLVSALKTANDPLAAQYADASEMATLAARMANLKADKGGAYPLLGGGDTNLYSLFVERAQALVKPNGIVGLLTPSGIAGDLSASAFFRSISTTGRLGALFDFENRGVYFPDVHRSFKFCMLMFGGAARRFDAAQCGFFLPGTDAETLAATTFALTPGDFAAVNPNTGTAPVFRTRRDADLTAALYGRLPVLVDRRNPALPRAALPVRYLRMFDMTNDSHLFRTTAELVADGWYRTVEGWRKGEAAAVPLYEGKMVQAFDHRAASVVVNLENMKRPAQPFDATREQHGNPLWEPDPQFIVESANVPENMRLGLQVGIKSITSPTNMRTVIAAMLPVCALGNSMALLTTDTTTKPLLLANMNAMALDFVARQKVQGQNLNWFIVEQLPVIPPAAYDRTFGTTTARDIVAREVLHLTYVAHDMAAFARDMGHVDAEGAALPPFAWNDEDRAQRRARLDALYFHLYGLTRDDADYILSTFPIVRRHDEAAHAGRYRTRDLILAHMAALDAGDCDVVVA